MKTSVKLIPPGTGKQQKNLPKKDVEGEKDAVQEDMRVVQGRLARKLLKQARKFTMHRNYKELDQ